MRRLQQTGKSNEAQQELLSASFVSDKYSFSPLTQPKRSAFTLFPKYLLFHLTQNQKFFTQTCPTNVLLRLAFKRFALSHGREAANFYSNLSKNRAFKIFTQNPAFRRPDLYLECFCLPVTAPSTLYNSLKLPNRQYLCLKA